jgi:hypothetical protein
MSTTTTGATGDGLSTTYDDSDDRLVPACC